VIGKIGRVLIVTLLAWSPLSVGQSSFTLGFVKNGHDEFGDEVDSSIEFFINGFQTGFVAMSGHPAIRGPRNKDSWENTKLMFRDCVFDESPSTTLSLMLDDAEANPDMLIESWLVNRIFGRCGSLLSQ
jgi:hypothetical protein